MTGEMPQNGTPELPACEVHARSRQRGPQRHRLASLERRPAHSYV